MKSNKRLFKYYPEDFGKLNVKVHHMDLEFDMYAKKTHVLTTIHLETLEDLKEILLNAKDLDLHEVVSDISKVIYTYDKDKDLITIRFSKKLSKGTKFTLTTTSTCYPTSNILEGLYYDETPKGCPCQMITQCQQWGFQRIVPCIDDMTAKCTYTTVIKADKSYTNYITNGDIIEKIKPISKTRVQITYENTKTPMATYLFFLGVGTYKTFKREFEYPNGDTFMLELLVPPKTKKDQAQKALKILHDAIMWVYVCTGPNKYDNEKISKKILDFVNKREQMKQENHTSKKLQTIKENLSKLIRNQTFGYKYTGTVYREIGMQNSDYGGMENVGNTTISTNRMLPFNDMTDPVFEYLIKVKVHEYYHNLNGSEVTGMSPFEIWLNEAVTVHIEREYHSYLFGEEYSRLSNVMSIIAPGNGILANDSGVQSLPILPEGFNSPNDLITSITYVKAPEFVRMIQKTLGKENFVKALNDYHTKYKHSNATTKDWLRAMQNYTDRDIIKMGNQWLNQEKFPKLEIKANYDKKKKTLTLIFNQLNATNTKFWSFPFSFALFSKNKISYENQLFIDCKEKIVTLENIKPYDFISFNREFSFYGKVEYAQSMEELETQILYDNDGIAKFLAMQKRFDIEKEKLFIDGNYEIDKNFLGIYMKLLCDKKTFNKLGGQFFSIFESIENVRYSFDYRKLYEIKNTLLLQLAQLYQKRLYSQYKEYSQEKIDSINSYPQQEINTIKSRQMKNIVLSILAKLDTKEIQSLLKKQISSNNATDKIIALRLYLETSARDKKRILENFAKKSRKNLVAWETYLSIVGSNNSSISLIKDVEKSPYFRIDQSNDQRALYVSFAFNKKMSLQTVEGRKYLEQILIKLTKINENTVTRIMGVFGNLKDLPKNEQIDLVSLLDNVRNKIDSKKHVIVYNTIKRILEKAPAALKFWKEKK